jgi:uncharacterized protein (TIGR00255 family)
MTGFGRGEASNSDVAVVVELKSVNNRFRDIQLRVPREYMALEGRINALLKAPFSRGRIDAFVRRSSHRTQSEVTCDTALAIRYAEAMRGVAEKIPGVVDARIPLKLVLSQPGVLTVSESVPDVMVEWDVVETAITAAIEDLKTMRSTEGVALHKDLSSNLDAVRVAFAQVEAVAVTIIDRLRTRVEARLQRLLQDRIEPQRLAQEAAILADKADVSEEITRLRSHCDQFATAMQSDEPVGRRLDFLLQEMNREVNTIGSKAVDLPIHDRVVDMKTVLERMREQSANVE